MTLREMMVMNMRNWDGCFDGRPTLASDGDLHALSDEAFLTLYDDVRREYLEAEFARDNESLSPSI